MPESHALIPPHTLTIILPQVETTEVSAGLRRLTRTLSANGYGGLGAGLGGDDGRGVDFENDVFMTHHYCWCDRDDCAWCRGCSCGDDQWHYFNKEGTEIDIDTFLDLSPHDRPEPRFEGERCPYCRGELKNEPNFRHKASNSTVVWYKYIGRGMRMSINAEWANILSECLRSVTPAQSAQYR
jgi:hypothetical protein